MASTPTIPTALPLSLPQLSSFNATAEYHLAASTSNTETAPKLNMADKEEPDKYLLIIAHFLNGYVNDTKVIDRYNGPVLKGSVKSSYWVFLIQYTVLAMTGIITNATIVAYIMYHRLYKDVTQAFIVNLALCHFVQCAVVMPVSLMVMLIQNWIFGKFLCFFLPMLQDIPFHVAMMTHMLIAWDRMRWLADPLKGRLPAFVCCCGTWLTGMIIAVPYPIYTIYVEIGEFIPRLSGIGLCVINLMDDIQEYVRWLFFMMYCAPTALLAYFYIRAAQELRPPEAPLAVMLYEHRVDIRMRQRNSSASSVDRSYSGATTATMGGTGSMAPYSTGTATRSYDLYSAEWDINREKRNQRSFGGMAATQVVCLCPLMILRFVRLSTEETYDNQTYFDIIYLVFVWIAFLPTVICPWIYVLQILPQEEQERLRGYFRLLNKSNHKQAKGCNDVRGGGRGAGDSECIAPSTRENSIEKDDNTIQSTFILPNGEGYVSASSGGGPVSARFENNKLGNHQPQAPTKQGLGEGMIRVPPPRHNKGGKACKQNENAAKLANGGGREFTKYMSNKNPLKSDEKAAGRTNTVASKQQQQSDVRINTISDGKTKVSAQRRLNSVDSSIGRASSLGGGQRKLTLESLDNRSCSNVTSSTSCNGNSSLLDDGDVCNYGDGENSSIVSGMIVQASSNASSAGLPPYFDKKPSGVGVYLSSGLHNRDLSFDDASSFSRLDSASTLAREMEVLDLLERERSRSDMQELLKADKNNDTTRRREGERRKLPDIEKICQKSPKHKVDPYSYENSNNTSVTSLSAKVPTTTDPLRTTDTFSLSSHLNEDDASLSLPYDKENILSSKTTQKSSIDEEVPSDFFDDYTPGDTTSIIPPAAATVSNAVQYQYSRRLSRKSSHHTPGSTSSHHHHNHRMSKRDSFNSLNSNDLIAGAFGELDPTQPLTKMSVIENRVVRRSSGGRASSFSSSARSSMKSRDYGHGSSHSTHPELDFRENFLADL